jgi:hypothetical protein
MDRMVDLKDDNYFYSPGEMTAQDLENEVRMYYLPVLNLKYM